MNRPRPDIIVRSPNGTTQLAVEIKALAGRTEDWAVEFRGNLMEYDALPDSRFFLLAMSDCFYLWSGKSPADAKPDYRISANAMLKQYMQSRHLKDLEVEELDGFSLQFLIRAWLFGLLGSRLTGDSVGEEYVWLLESGLYESVRSGYIEAEPEYA